MGNNSRWVLAKRKKKGLNDQNLKTVLRVRILGRLSNADRQFHPRIDQSKFQNRRYGLIMHFV